MDYLQFLAGVHDRLAPRTYLEIGVNRGHSLTVSRCPSIGVDPRPAIDQEITAPVEIVVSTSDDYFDALEGQGRSPFGELPVDLCFIDGMHHFENALRDFLNVERHCAPSSVIAVDDVLPRDVDEAARDRHTEAWTGDVFHIAAALRAHRGDLIQILVDTEPTGTLLVAGVDPANRTLGDGFDAIVGEYLRPDPQSVPDAVLRRQGAISPDEALALPLWEQLRAARDTGRLSI